MNLVWNLTQAHLKVYKEAPTYTIFYTKQCIWTQVVKQTGEFVEFPCLLFENGLYKGPDMDGMNRTEVYTEDQMKHVAEYMCFLFQNKEVKKTWWVSYS
jgi:hypothetical protein